MTSAPSEFSEDFSDSETSAAIIPCFEDDKEFTRNARARNIVDVDGEEMIQDGKRVALLWEALRRLPSGLRQRVFFELLQGSDDRDNVWLWNEGDEALMEWDEDWLKSPPPWTSAAAALERRLARTPPRTLRRREVQSATLEMRTAMIVWVALTSAAYKSADEERGVRDREEWEMQGLIDGWYFSLPGRVQEWLVQHSESYDDQAFTGAMDQAGHSCHRQIEHHEGCWLFMRSQLLPAQQDHIIYLRDEHCASCLVHKPTHESESPPSWTPSCALVALRFIWDSTADSRDDIDASRDLSEWLSHQPIYGFKEANEFLSSLPRDTDEDRYLSWVNEYPRCLRYTVTKCTLVEWQAMDDCITTSERSGSLNIRSWCATMSWTMMPRGLSHSIRVKQFIEVWRYCGFEWFSFLPPPAPAPEFRDTIRESGHTCWKESQMDDYAAAMAFLDEDPNIVGINVQKDSRCQVCRLQWHLKELAQTLPVEERAFSVDLTELLVMLRTECSRRKVAWSDISTSAQKKFIDTSFSDFSEEAETSDAGMDDDEASGEDERAPGTLIHPSQDNTATSHRENNPILGVIYDNEAVDVDEESADMTGRLIFTNPSSENPHPHSVSDPSFGHIPDVPLHPPTFTNPQTYIGYQGGTVAPWNHGLPEGGSDPTVGRQQGYIGTSASNFVEKASMGKNGGLRDYVPIEASAVTYPTGNHVRPQITSALDSERDVGFRSRNTPRINSQSHASSVAIIEPALPSKRQMAEEIKKHLTDEMGKSFLRVGISLAQTDKGQVKLPWLDFETTLGENRVRMINWPAGVARPGKDLSKDTSKGIYGVRLDSLTKIYRAIRDSTAPIQLIREETVLPNGLYTMSGDPETSVSRKRTRDSGDDEHETSPPERGGKLKNIYEATVNAANSDDAMNTRAIVESLGRTRALDLAILCVLFAFHISAKRSTDSLFVLAAILLVRSIGVLYDGLDHDGFKKRVNIMGPLGFTLVNSVPGLMTTALVFRAVIIVSLSPAMVVLPGHTHSSIYAIYMCAAHNSGSRGSGS
ncbi:hypothetical protein C8J56DRAFT_1165474 [Mycena floridula]|nr:hypothetical protein C8J56DRAFT_1165474 [Mycena floridula]